MPLPASEALCVLVADDEMPARQRIIDLLRSRSQGVAIIEASDGLSAVEIIQDRRPDLVFLDVQMSELNGLEVVAEVEAQLVEGLDYFIAKVVFLERINWLKKRRGKRLEFVGD